MSQVPPNLSVLIKDVSSTPSIVVIEPDDTEARPLCRVITEHYGQEIVTRQNKLADVLNDPDIDDYSLAISAMDVGDASGLKVIEELLLLRPDLPIVMLTEDHDKVVAAKALREGAYDYVIKSGGYLSTIPAIIEKNLALYQVKQENARLQIQLTATLGQLRTRNDQLQSLVKDLKAIAATDALTGIANRRAITQSLDQRFAHALRHNTDLSLIAIDLDGFKSLNDAAGHPAGDRVLMQVARVLSANARASDLPGRIGGDEFIVVLPEIDAQEAARVAERVQDDFELAFSSLAARIEYEGQVTMSVGVVARSQSGAGNANDLLAAADRALYRAKDAGRSCIVVDAASE